MNNKCIKTIDCFKFTRYFPGELPFLVFEEMNNLIIDDMMSLDKLYMPTINGKIKKRIHNNLIDNLNDILYQKIR